jgi:hypothetical protein
VGTPPAAGREPGLTKWAMSVRDRTKQAGPSVACVQATFENAPVARLGETFGWLATNVMAIAAVTFVLTTVRGAG